MDVRGKGRGSGLTGRERGGILDWLFGKGVRGNGLAVWVRVMVWLFGKEARGNGLAGKGAKGNGPAVWERVRVMVWLFGKG